MGSKITILLWFRCKARNNVNSSMPLQSKSHALTWCLKYCWNLSSVLAMRWVGWSLVPLGSNCAKGTDTPRYRTRQVKTSASCYCQKLRWYDRATSLCWPPPLCQPSLILESSHASLAHLLWGLDGVLTHADRRYQQ